MTLGVKSARLMNVSNMKVAVPHSASTLVMALVMALIMVAGLLGPLAVVADTMYVTDQLRLGLHRAEDTGDRPYRTLTSGAALEVIERNRFYAHVRTTDGNEGWVKVAYLVEGKPAALRVTEVETRSQQLENELDSLKRNQSTASVRVGELEKELINWQSLAGNNDDEMTRLRSENQSYAQRMATYRNSVPLLWALIAASLTLVVGSIAGYQWLDRRIRRRFGGLRVY